MSLLLDALKRAEQEKLAKQGGERGSDAERARAVSAKPANETPSLELAPIAGAGAAPSPLAGRADPAAAAAAQNVFAAKEMPAAERSRKGVWLWVALGVLVVGLAAAGGYVWFSVASFTPRTAASARPRPAPIGQLPPAADTAPKLDILTPPPQQPTAAIQPPATVAAVDKGAEPARGDPRAAVAELLREAAAAPAAPAPPVKLAPSPEKPRVSADVAAGYSALRNGDFESARRSYHAAISADPYNIDAQLGAATLAARSGNRALAASHYHQALEADPRNATALAGLASLAEPSRVENIESSLRADLAQSPRSAQLHYALGNFFASQSRWQEAQSEYFEAHSLDPASADIVYNLAVSLDQLRQTRLAADYYRRALEAARNGPTQFDPAAVTRRLAEMR